MGSTTAQFTLTVQAAASTVLSKILNEMQAASPSAPLWSYQLGTSTSQYLARTHPDRTGTLQISDYIDTWGGGALAAGSGGRRAFHSWNDGISIELLMGNNGPYTATGWDESTGLWHVAGTTQSKDYSQTVVRYNPATDEFRRWGATADGDSAGSLWPGYGGAHNFGQTVIDTAGRRLFRLVNAGSVEPSSYLAWVYFDDLAGGVNRAATRLGRNTTAQAGYLQPITLFPNAGVGGQIVVMRCATPGATSWARYNVAENQWTTPLTTPARVPNQAARVYHNGYTYLAGKIGASGLEFWRFTSDGVFETDLTPTPEIMDGAAQSGTDAINNNYNQGWYHTEFVALGDYLYAFKPGDPFVSGNRGKVYRFDTTNPRSPSAWSVVDEMPQVDLGIPVNNNGGNYPCFSVCAVPSLNCVIFLQTALNLNGGYINDWALVWKP